MSLPTFAAAHAFAAQWQEAADATLTSLAAPPGSNLGFVYFSDQFAESAEPLLAYLKQSTGIEDWVGSMAVGICGAGTAAIDKPGLALLVGRFPDESFQVFSGRSPLSQAGTAPYFAVVHADPNTPDMPDLIADMAGKVSSGFVTGGLSSARGSTRQVANGLLSGGISGVAFSPQVHIATRLTQGCSPLPGRYRIDECERNVIARIDGQAALDVYRSAVGEALSRDLRRAAQTVLVGLPVAGRESSDYRVRHVIGIDTGNGLLAISEEVQTGDALLFCRRGGAAAEQDMQRMLDELRSSLQTKPKAGLYFSCLGRGHSMFPEDSTELEMIAKTFGDLPVAGFFCSGEISHDQLYGYTGVLTLFL